MAAACDGGALEGSAAAAGVTAVTWVGVALEAAADGVEAPAGDGEGPSGVQAVRAAKPAPAVSKPANALRLGIGWGWVCTLDLPQKHATDGVVCVLGKYQLGAATGGEHVLFEVRLVDALPDAAGC